MQQVNYNITQFEIVNNYYPVMNLALESKDCRPVRLFAKLMIFEFSYVPNSKTALSGTFVIFLN